MRLFISYARKNKELVEKLVEILEQGGHDVWVDDHIHLGEEWKRRLALEIEKADGIVVTLSPEWNDSKFCQWEFNRAFELGKKIIPTLIIETKLPKRIHKRNYADFTEGFDNEDLIQNFLDDLHKIAEIIRNTKHDNRQDNKNRVWIIPVISVLFFLFVATILILSNGVSPNEKPAQISSSSDISTTAQTSDTASPLTTNTPTVGESAITLSTEHPITQTPSTETQLLLVTNQDYQQFIVAGAYLNDNNHDIWTWSSDIFNWREGLSSIDGPHGYHEDENPNSYRTGVSWFEAATYCHWIGGSLPTQEELQQAIELGLVEKSTQREWLLDREESSPNNRRLTQFNDTSDYYQPDYRFGEPIVFRCIIHSRN